MTPEVGRSAEANGSVPRVESSIDMGGAANVGRGGGLEGSNDE